MKLDHREPFELSIPGSKARGRAAIRVQREGSPKVAPSLRSWCLIATESSTLTAHDFNAFRTGSKSWSTS